MKVNIPEVISNPPALPLPWRPSERAIIRRELLRNPDNTRSMELLSYSIDIDRQYIITDIGVQAVNMAVGYTSVGADVFYGKHLAKIGTDDMQREFEQDVLGLEPTPYGDGLRCYDSPAGGDYGIYPRESLAQLVGATSEHLHAVLHDKELMKYGHVILRSNDWLVPVNPNPANNETVQAGRASKLSDTGNALVDTALYISDYSTA